MLRGALKWVPNTKIRGARAVPIPEQTAFLTMARTPSEYTHVVRYSGCANCDQIRELRRVA